MKNLSFVLLGVTLGVAVLFMTSARAAVAGELRAGATVYGLNLVNGTSQPLKGIGADSPITIREVSDGWVQVDAPTLKGGPTWVHMDNIVSFRTSR